MSRFNAQLQAMIREGQQALGSKIEVEIDGEVEDDDVDEGFYEDGGFEEGGRVSSYANTRPSRWS